MSRGRFDRNRAARTQRWEQDYFSLNGGLDELSAPLSRKPGRLAQCVNFEEIFGKQGYQFIKGYERFDGSVDRPSQTTYTAQPFTTGTATISAGDAIDNGSGATATVAHVILSSGSFAGGDAAGDLILLDSAGTWASGNQIRVGGVQRATASDDPIDGSWGYGNHQEAMTAAREYRRALIAAVPGEGEILGGAIFQNTVFVVRNAVGGASATLWYSTPAGWNSYKPYLPPSTPYRFEVANFTGDPTRTGLYVVNGKTGLFSITLDTLFFTPAAVIYGSQGTSTSSVALSVGAGKTFTIAQSSRSWQAGDEITAWVTSGSYPVAHVYMRGTVTSYNSGTNTLVMNATEVSDGLGTAPGPFTAWEIGRTDYSDKPFLIRAHKNHMFLAFPRGQLQTSNLGDPMVYTSTASLFGLGSDIVGLESLKGKALGVFCEDRISVIEGSSQTNWDKQDYSTSLGAVAETVQENDGNPLFLSKKGVMSLQATQNFGDLESAIFSRDVKKTLDAKHSLVVGSRMAADNNQYRLYFSDKTCMRFTITTGNAVVTPRDVSPTISEYLHQPSCLFSGIINGEERMFFGTSDGYVMEEDVGTSFDGQAIDYAMRLPPNFCKSPANDKQFHKMEIEVEPADPVTLYFRQFFDNDDGTLNYGSGSIELNLLGGRYDVDAFDTFQFDTATLERAEAALDGQGRNMSLLLWARSDFVRPVLLQSMLIFYTKLGVRP
jgi:hypothetical protein